MGRFSKRHGQMAESKRKSFYKTISWRILGTFSGFVIVFFVTKKPSQAIMTAAFVGPINTILYYFHERLWSKKK